MLIILRLLILSIFFTVTSLPQTGELKSKLADAGFENIKVKVIDNKLFLAYEDRVNRFNASGLAEVLELVEEWGGSGEVGSQETGDRRQETGEGGWETGDRRQEVGRQETGDRRQEVGRQETGDRRQEVGRQEIVGSQETGDRRREKEVGSQRKNEGFNEIRILMMKDNVPLTLVTKNESGVIITNGTDEVNDLLRDEESENSSLYKFDIIIHPGLKTQFGNYDNPVRAQVNIIPEIRTSLWRGMTLSAQAIIPLYNEFPGEGEYVRPGITALNQILYLNEAWFFSSTAGYFTENRYGIAAETRKTFWDGIFSVGAEAGYTGFLSIFDNKIIYSYPYYWTALADVELRISKYDLTLGVTAGSYLYNDRSVRFDINRQFGEVEIGFFFNKSFKYDSNGGINFSIPIFPSSYSRPGIVRVRPADNFSYEYRVRGKIYNFSGRMFETGFSLKKDLNRYNPSFIENYLMK